MYTTYLTNPGIIKVYGGGWIITPPYEGLLIISQSYTQYSELLSDGDVLGGANLILLRQLTLSLDGSICP